MHQKFLTMLVCVIFFISFHTQIQAQPQSPETTQSIIPEATPAIVDPDIPISSEDTPDQSTSSEPDYSVSSSESADIVQSETTSIPQPESSQTPIQSSSSIQSSPVVNSKPTRPSHSSKSSSSKKDSSSEKTEPNNQLWTENMATILSLTCDWLKTSEQGNLYFTCMGTAGKSAIAKLVNQYITDVSLISDYQNALSLSYDILNVTFCGYHATNVLGVDLISEFTSFSYDDFSGSDLYTIAYSLLALDCNFYQLPNGSSLRSDLKSLLCLYQNPDGGFFSHTNASQSTVKQTALALSALSPYKQETEIQDVIHRALDYLATQQLPNGGFIENGQESSIALSKVIIALNSLGIPDDARFIKQNQPLSNLLLNYVNTDSGFSDVLETPSDVVATENAILALSSIKKKSSPYILSVSLQNNSTHTNSNIIIESQPQEEPEHPFDWATNSLPIFLGGFAIVLMLGFILMKIHAIQKRKKSSEDTNAYHIDESTEDFTDKDKPE